MKKTLINRAAPVMQFTLWRWAGSLAALLLPIAVGFAILEACADPPKTARGGGAGQKEPATRRS